VGHRRLLIAALALVVCAGSGCARAIQARVVDAETRQPIAGAVVLGVWTTLAGLPGLYHHKLVGVRETETDADGRFTLERLESSGLDGEGGGQAITIYKLGYVAWSNLFVFPTSALRENQRVPREIPLERFPPGGSRSRHMSFISNAMGAGLYGYDAIPKFSEALKEETEMARRDRR